MSTSRRDFLRSSCAAAALLTLGADLAGCDTTDPTGGGEEDPGLRPSMFWAPYAMVDWTGVQVPSLSHGHGRTKARFDAWVGAGYSHLAISDYYPSDPALTYPLTKLAGVTPDNLPPDVIGCPNAEHHSFTDCPSHFNAIGSLLSSGGPLGGSPLGYGGPWRSFVDDAVAAMRYPGGGTISINHPSLPGYMGRAAAAAMLDYSPYVGGIEIFNLLLDWYYPGLTGFALDHWHDLLVTGRRCWGFCSLDHWDSTFGPQPPRGRNVLLLPASYATMDRAAREAACAVAYHEGRFYGQLAATSPRLVGMSADRAAVSVEFEAPCEITFYYARPGDQAARATEPVTATTAAYPLQGKEVYVRAEGRLSAAERTFSQPVMYMDRAGVLAYFSRHLPWW